MKILVVDDSRTSLAVAESHLKNIQEISEIILCEYPEKAFDFIKERAVDIILLDIVMPGIDGYEVLRLLRSDHQYDDIPVIMFTQLSGDDTLKKCFDLGASDYIAIPIRPVEFMVRIKAAVEARRKSISLKNMLVKMSSQNNELMAANKKLEEATFQLVSQDKMAAIGQLAAGVAHEINNPLGYVSSNCETIQKYLQRLLEFYNIADPVITAGMNSEDPAISVQLVNVQREKLRLKVPTIIEELSGILSDTHEGLRRVYTIVQSLRTFARSASEDELGSFGIDEIINQVLLISHNEVKHAAQVSVDLPGNIYIYCNKVTIGQVFLNIIINAAQAIQAQNRPELGAIRINAAASDGSVFVTVEDDGPGIAPEHLDKVFEPFFTTKEVGRGTGLGLSISYEIVQRINGSISVDSTVGIGTKFTVRLPLHEQTPVQ